MILPNVNKECMGIFLHELSKEIGEQEIILVMDGAGWHKNLSEIPQNIEIVLLPPYSPELNPVERFWQYIKNGMLKNKVYENLDQLESSLVEFLNNITANVIASVCNCNYIPS